MIDALIKAKTDNFSIQLLRYFFAGSVAFIFDFVSLYFLTEYIGMYYLVSAMFAFLIGLAINYVISVRWVFKNRNLKSKKMEGLIFAGVGLAGLLLNNIFIWFFTEIFYYNYMVSKIITTAMVFFWNFFIRKFTLYR